MDLGLRTSNTELAHFARLSVKFLGTALKNLGLRPVTPPRGVHGWGDKAVERAGLYHTPPLPGNGTCGMADKKEVV